MEMKEHVILQFNFIIGFPSKLVSQQEPVMVILVISDPSHPGYEQDHTEGSQILVGSLNLAKYKISSAL